MVYKLYTLTLILIVCYLSNSFRFKSFHKYSNKNVINNHNVIKDEIIPNQLASPLKQLLLQFDCNDIDSDELSELMLELGSLSVSVEVLTERKDYLNDESNWNDLIKTKSWATALIKSNFPSSFDINGVINIIKSIYSDNELEFTIEDVINKDWISEIQKDWKPQIIGDLTIKFPWHCNISQSTSKELILEGGAAFGTGDHPTTRLCCRWLDKIISTNINTAINVLDYGCGSGILGLAALRYGAKHATGVDIDKDALISCNNNCLLNNLPMKLYITSNDDIISDEESSILMNNLRGNAPNSLDFPIESVINDRFTITVANILAPILIQLAGKLADYTESNGYIGLSGLVKGQEDSVIAAYSPYFYGLTVENIENDWILVTGRKI